ncbi:hypothetical protein HMPREF9689_01745 [Klebsiella oxytoca 10-5245]|nr:hypothetical protein HMPREF9689_01745 [Klebsiella oxytoca 10-5245]
MYLDSDTKVIISGAVILLVGIIVWKKQSFFIALVFCVLFIKASMMFLAIVMLLSWGEPANSFYFIFPVISVFIAAAILLAGCDRPAREKNVSGGSGTIEAVNHTHWAINHFSVDGQSGLDIIGPWQGGGGGCCYGVPTKWKPGMTVKVEWETGVGYSMDFPGYGDDAKYLEWEKK